MPALDEAQAREAKEEVRAGWTQQSTAWVKHAALLRDWTRDATMLVVDGAGARPGDRVLDVASGPGETAIEMARVVGPRGSVVATDLVPEMVKGADANAHALGVTNMTFRDADAEALPFPDRSFDRVTCRHGVMFFPRPEVGLREMRRVLKPGGTVSLLAWAPLEANPFFLTATGPFMRRLPTASPAPGDAPGPFRFGTPGTLSGVLTAAGFDGVREETREVPWDFPGTPEAFVATVRELSSSVYEWLGSELTPAQFDAASADVLAEARRRNKDGRVRFHAAVVLATARAP